MGLIIAGDRSGVGKTTITLAILAWLKSQGKQVQSFKVGPDYIDPMFHSSVTGYPCRNLDPVLTSPAYVRECFAIHSRHREGAIIEGVMGLFDGVRDMEQPSAFNDYGSTAHVARILDLPVVLVMDCSHLSSSIAAIAFGYARFDPRVKIAGVILNQVGSDRHLELLTTALTTISMPILGVLRRNSQVTIPDRHLGLVPSSEISQVDQIFSRLADLAQTSFYWDRLLPLIERSPVIPSPSKNISPPTPSVKIAVARDSAFNFYYQDNLDILQQLGAELVFWSPLEDGNIPHNIHGLYFGGGFPEIFASELASNKTVLKQLQQIITNGIPTYGECGGLMYLCHQLIDLQGKSWSMVGVIPSQVTMKAKLTLGYRQATAIQDSPLAVIQQQVVGHEFHRSQLTIPPAEPQWELRGLHKSSQKQAEGWHIHQLHASYLHLHWGEYRHIPQRFIQYCRNYKTSLY